MNESPQFQQHTCMKNEEDDPSTAVVHLDFRTGRYADPVVLPRTHMFVHLEAAAPIACIACMVHACLDLAGCWI